jgi:hypothetical protein
MDEFGQIHGTGPFQRWFFTGLDAVAWGFGYGSMPRLKRLTRLQQTLCKPGSMVYLHSESKKYWLGMTKMAFELLFAVMH